MSKRRTIVFMALLALLLIPATASADGDIKLYGFVVDIDGRQMANNLVYLNSSMISLQTQSTDTGYYEFTSLEAGLYNLSTSNILNTLEIPLNLTESRRCDLSMIAAKTDRNPWIELQYVKEEKAKTDEPIILGYGNETTAIIDLTGAKEKLQPYFWPTILIIGVLISAIQLKKQDGSSLTFCVGLFLILIWALYNSKIAIILGGD